MGLSSSCLRLRTIFFNVVLYEILCNCTCIYCTWNRDPAQVEKLENSAEVLSEAAQAKYVNIINGLEFEVCTIFILKRRIAEVHQQLKTTERITTNYWIKDEAGNKAYQNIDSHHLPGVHSSTIYCAARVTQEIGKDEERQWDGQEQSVYQAQHMLTRPVKFYYRSLREATH